MCTKETDDTPSLWSISGTQGIPHLCPRQSKSPRSQTLVLLWTRRCVCVESPGPTGLVLLASTNNKIMLVRSSRLYKFARRTKNITECPLIRQRWPGYCRSLQTFAPCLRWVKLAIFAMSALRPFRPQLRTFCCLAANYVQGQSATFIRSTCRRAGQSFAGICTPKHKKYPERSFRLPGIA